MESLEHSSAQKSIHEKSVKIRTSTAQVDMVPGAIGEIEISSMYTNLFNQWKPQIAESILEVTEL